VGRQMCASLYNDAVPEEDIDAVAMDELPYDDNSVDIAVHSLSLHDTMHNSRRAKKAGGERIRALQTLNRVLKKEDGVAVITLPPHCFENEQGFVAFLNILDKYFGFDVLLEDCGHVRSTDRTDEKKYEAYVVVVRKREDAAPAEQIMEQMKKEDWYALDLFFFKESTEGRRKPKQPEEEEEREDQSGSFHGEFEVSLYGESQELSYVPTEIQERERDLHDEAKRQYNTIESRIHEMREKYGSFAAIPEEELLAISPEEIKDEERESQIAYYKALLEKYGSAEAIPYDEINKHSSVVLVRASVKRGVYLCIAPLEDENKKNGKIKRWYKNRFFIEEDPDYQTEMKERKYKAAQKSAEARKKKKAS
ncbi:MAG: hypothetical protein QF815_00125, partial [Candidatus Peribacteraceae bacterium]|nr:hypothetical protein [Candidatus Peribacteraceae bacterium]